jgi:hypothetical protein
MSAKTPLANDFAVEFCDVFGGCSECRGIASAGQLRYKSNPVSYRPTSLIIKRSYAPTGATIMQPSIDA